LGKTLDGPGEMIDVDSLSHRSIIGAKSDEGFALIVKHLIENGMLNGNAFNTMGALFGANITLSFKAWDYFKI
jgi:hypothetical protein